MVIKHPFNILFLQGLSTSPWLPWKSLCRSGPPGAHGEPPSSTSECRDWRDVSNTWGSNIGDMLMTRILEVNNRENWEEWTKSRRDTDRMWVESIHKTNVSQGKDTWLCFPLPPSPRFPPVFSFLPITL